ncbi:sentrin-specific protease 8-like [Brevipalpus obovatus]|uniref:sentrin-specific protease 8-like n=1 Tax=Brevipalpus obovatus TaxID=246614 RepID=UPI003D9E7A4B
MASEGKTVLSYHDVLLRQSELTILQSNQWLNDVIISFWFEYLQHEVFGEFKDVISFIAPEMVQFLKSASPEFSANGCPISVDEIKSMLEPLQLSSKRIIFFPISDSPINSTSVDGSHWSLLVYLTQSGETNATDDSIQQSSSTTLGRFEHYDSFTGSVNHTHASAVRNVMSSILITGSFLGKSEEEEDDVTTSHTLMVEMECTQQVNGFDCGVHVLCNCEAVCRRLLMEDGQHITQLASLDVIKRKRREICVTIGTLSKT